MVKRCFVFLAFVSLLSPVSAQKLTTHEREILWRQDQRMVEDTVLIAYLRHKESRIRRQAALALANIQDTATVSPLLPLLNDKVASVRSAAAFALGLIGSTSSETALADRLRQETNGTVIPRLLEALGRSGSSQSYDDVVAFGLPRKLAPLKADIAVALARFALRNIKSDRGVTTCFDLLEEDDDRVRWSALYALWRMAPLPVIDQEISKRVEQLKKLALSRNADVRMHLATLLGKTRAAEAEEIMESLRRIEMRRGRGDWRAQVNLVRSYGLWAPRSKTALKNILFFLFSSDEHVLMSALNAAASVPRDALKGFDDEEKLRNRLEALALPSSRRSESIRGEALIAIARLFPSNSRATAVLADSKSSNLLRAKAIEAMSFIPSGESLQIVLDHLEEDSIRVSMAAWDHVRRLVAPPSFRVFRRDTAVTRDLGARLFRKVKVSLLREDMAVTTLVATALADSSIHALLKQEGYSDRALEELMLAFGKLSSPNDVEAMQAILATLGKIGDDRTIPLLERALADPDRTVAQAAATALRQITRVDYSSSVPASSRPVFTDYDWKALEAIPKNQTVEVKTRKGTIVMRLHREEAAFTVLSFVKLVRKRFYDGLTFHRVVPNFVIQGGDPRGDGWGGPNYAIRTEVSFLQYGRGEVGIASAGKDTEGCQFFVTHSPQPHLDGRYTIFASVVSGMDVVDQIQVGDTIVSIRLRR